MKVATLTILAAALLLSPLACGADDPGSAPALAGAPSEDPRPTPVGPGEPSQVEIPDPAAPRPSRAKISLGVGPPVLGRVLPFQRERYSETEIEDLLAAVRAASGPLCRHRHGLEPLDRRAAGEFVKPMHRFLTGPLGDKWSLISGCWNFVRMNDRRPYRDFEVLRSLYDSPTGYACQAVGVMQPYIMSELLDCRSITMLDFDWQIQAVHWQLLRAWSSGGLAPDRLDASLGEIRIDWVAHHSPREGHDVGIGTLCHPSMLDRCRKTLEAFGQRMVDPSLESVTLRLAGLHTLELPSPDVRAPLQVIFLSNATEKHFLTHREFQALLQRVTDSLAPGQRAVLIHHVAADWAFGIYELEGSDAGAKLRVRCRDEYIRNKATSHPKPYETWFESELRRRAGGRPPPVPPACQDLRRGARAAARDGEPLSAPDDARRTPQ